MCFIFQKKLRLFSQNDVLFLFYFLINPAGTTGQLIAKKEGKFYTNVKDFQNRIKALPFEAGQNVWL